MLASQERPVEENPPLNRDTHAPSSSPSAFGRFRVVHQVGAGVLGPVFRAYDPETERTVALKSFPLDLTPEQAGRLGDSLAHLATLDLGHPSLIVPIAAGAEGSTAYLVEEYFVADSVDIAIRQYGPAPVPDAVRLVGQLAGGLDFAAAAGVHHGVLHPRDVLVAPREVRLTGIGVAQALEDVGFRVQPRRPYSAPERFEPVKWDVTADVYSLAALAYELLTGRRPAASGDTVTVEPQAIPSSDAAALAEVFARAFSRAPGDRFPSALAFAAALKHALTGQPIEASADAERPRSRRARSGARRAAMLPLDEPEATAPGTPDVAANLPVGGAVDVTASEPPAPAAAEPTRAVPPEAPMSAAAAEEAPSPAAAPEVIAPITPGVPMGAVEPYVIAEPHVIAEPAVPSEPPASPLEPPPMAEPPSTLPRADTSELREALRAAEPELPAPPPAIDDLDLRPQGPEPPASRADDSYELEVGEATEEPRFTALAPDSASAPDAPFEPTAPPVSTPAADAKRLRSFDESASRPPPLTPAYRPTAPPRRSSPAATLLIVALMAIALAVAGGYYAASRYLGRRTPSSESASPASTTPGTGGAEAPQGQVPAPSPETIPPEPSLPAAEPGVPGTAGGAAAPAAAAPPPSVTESPAPPVASRPAAAAPAPAGKTGAGATAKRPGGGSRKTDAANAPSRPATPKTASRAAPSARRSPTVFEGGLSIASRPSGARVYLDGHPVGTTPMTLSKVSAGSHVVRLQSDGYATWSGAIQVTAGALNRVTASLDRVQR